MILKVDLVDLRQMIREKSDEVCSDKNMADCLYQIFSDIEDDDRFEELEVQTPVPPYEFVDIMKCGYCGDGVVGRINKSGNHYITRDAWFCPACGKAVKWDD